MGRRKNKARWFIVLLVLVIIGLLALFNSYDGVFVDKTSKPVSSSSVTKTMASLPAPLPLLKIPPRPASDSIRLITPTKYFSGIFWKIEKPGYKPSWLLGTIHVDDLRVLGLVDRETAGQFKQAQTLCTEVKLDYIAKIKMTTAMFYKSGRTLRQDIGDTLFDRVVEVAKRKKIPAATLNKMKPWAAWVLLVMPLPKRDTLDEKLFKTAILQRKKLCGLENIDDHMSVFTKTPLAQQIKFLQYAVDNIELIKKQSSQLIEIYLKGNLKEVFSLMDDSPMTKDKELLNDYFYRLVVKRNYIMVNSMLPRLREGNVFFAVGALHLTGTAGVLQLLEKRGFKVSRIH